MRRGKEKPLNDLLLLFSSFANDSHNEFILRIMAIIHCNTTHSQSHEWPWPMHGSPIRWYLLLNVATPRQRRLNTNRLQCDLHRGDPSPFVYE